MKTSRILRLVGGVAVAAVLTAMPQQLSAQGLTWNKGQSVAPAYEGWEQNADGSFNLVFGYMNRNWQETPNVPVGVNNTFGPGDADRGQPTHFLPRRNRFVFKVPVPADFGDKELVWTLTVAGEELKAYGSLLPEYYLDNVVVMSETGTLGAGTSSPELRSHTPPVVAIENSGTLQTCVGRPVRLVANVTDDGLPRAGRGRLPVTTAGSLDFERAVGQVPSRITVNKISGLHMTWFVYRAPDEFRSNPPVDFNPPQVNPWEDTRPYSNSPWSSFWVPPTAPADNRWIAEATFDRPGEYVLKGRADDGGLFTDALVTVRVAPTC